MRLTTAAIEKIQSRAAVAEAAIVARKCELAGYAIAIGCIQGLCRHTWKFQKQWNAYHEHFWIVQYKCDDCGTERKDRKIPVCKSCDTPLVRCGREDVAAEAERQKPEYKGDWNPPLAFRCPKDRKIHILWHQGD